MSIILFSRKNLSIEFYTIQSNFQNLRFKKKKNDAFHVALFFYTKIPPFLTDSPS